MTRTIIIDEDNWTRFLLTDCDKRQQWLLVACPNSNYCEVRGSDMTIEEEDDFFSVSFNYPMPTDFQGRLETIKKAKLVFDSL
jgi:hypothetical protein